MSYLLYGIPKVLSDDSAIFMLTQIYLQPNIFFWYPVALADGILKAIRRHLFYRRHELIKKD